MTNTNPDRLREAQRQSLLLQVLWRRAPDTHITSWLNDQSQTQARGLQAYRGNAQGGAERALSAAFPTVLELIGAEAFASLSAAYWMAQPPRGGDLAWLGQDLSEFIAADPQLAGEPYLTDVARLDWALHRCELSADPPRVVAGLAALAQHDPANLFLSFCPGAGLLESTWPIVTIYACHQQQASDRFVPVQAAMAAEQGECAWVWRQAWRAQVCRLDSASAGFMRGLMAGQSLGQVLEGAAADFSFEAWLATALREGWLARWHPG